MKSLFRNLQHRFLMTWRVYWVKHGGHACCDVTHWFVDSCFQASVSAWQSSPSLYFLKPEMIIFGREGGAEEDTHRCISILIGSDWEHEDARCGVIWKCEPLFLYLNNYPVSSFSVTICTWFAQIFHHELSIKVMKSCSLLHQFTFLVSCDSIILIKVQYCSAGAAY